MVSSRTAVRLADELGVTADTVNSAFRGVSDQEALAFLRQSQPRSARGEFAAILADQPSRITDNAVSGTKRFLLGAGAVGGATAVGWKGAESVGELGEAWHSQNQEQALQDILTDPHVSDATKNELVKDLMGQGFFSSGDDSDDGSGSPLAGLGLLESAIILIIVWYAGKALVAKSGG